MRLNTQTTEPSDRTKPCESTIASKLTKGLCRHLLDPTAHPFDICDQHNLTLPELHAIVDSEHFRVMADHIAAISQARESLNTPHARFTAIRQLTELAESPHHQSPLEARAAETTRRAAAALERATRPSLPRVRGRWPAQPVGGGRQQPARPNPNRVRDHADAPLSRTRERAGVRVFPLLSSQPPANNQSHSHHTPPRRTPPCPGHQPAQGSPMQLGNFSVSLAVKDLQASKAFYTKLGFAPAGGNESQNWLVLQNGTVTIGLFQGMFDKNMLTFNPGWDADKQTLPTFTDVRDLQAQLRAKGIEFDTEADESTTDPAHFVITDPDGNPILIDQHVPKPTN